MPPKLPPTITPYRPILPAAGGDDVDPLSPVTSKRKVTTVACKPCQRKKRKVYHYCPLPSCFITDPYLVQCDGGRPRCSACALSGGKIECVYDTRGGQSRSDALRERMTELQSENLQLKRILSGPADNPAMEVSYPAQPIPCSCSYHQGSSKSQFAEGSIPTSPLDPPYGEEHSSVESATPLSRSTSLESSKSRIPNLQAKFMTLNATEARLGLQGGPSMPLWPNASGPDSEVVQALIEQQPQQEMDQAQHMAVDPPQQQSQGIWFRTDISTAENGLLDSGDLIRYASPYIYQPKKRGRYLELFGNLPLSGVSQSDRFTGLAQSSQPQSIHLPVYLIQMLNWDDIQVHESILTPEFASCTLSTFRAYGRRSLADGISETQILGAPDRPDIDVQQFFQIREGHDLVAHTTATFAPWFLGAYPSMTLAVKVACSILVQALLRVRTIENIR